MELEILLHRVDVVEDIVHNPGDNSLLVGVVNDTLHGVGFTARSLAVGKYSSVVSTQNI